MQGHTFWEEVNTVSPYIEYKTTLEKMAGPPYGIGANGKPIKHELNSQTILLFDMLKRFAGQRAIEHAEPGLDAAQLRAIADEAGEAAIDELIKRLNTAAPDGYEFSREWFAEGSIFHSHEANTFLFEYCKELTGDPQFVYKNGALYDIPYADRLYNLMTLEQLFVNILRLLAYTAPSARGLTIEKVAPNAIVGRLSISELPEDGDKPYFEYLVNTFTEWTMGFLESLPVRKGNYAPAKTEVISDWQESNAFEIRVEWDSRPLTDVTFTEYTQQLNIVPSEVSAIFSNFDPQQPITEQPFGLDHRGELIQQVDGTSIRVIVDTLKASLTESSISSSSTPATDSNVNIQARILEQQQQKLLTQLAERLNNSVSDEQYHIDNKWLEEAEKHSCSYEYFVHLGYHATELANNPALLYYSGFNFSSQGQTVTISPLPLQQIYRLLPQIINNTTLEILSPNIVQVTANSAVVRISDNVLELPPDEHRRIFPVLAAQLKAILYAMPTVTKGMPAATIDQEILRDARDNVITEWRVTWQNPQQNRNWLRWGFVVVAIMILVFVLFPGISLFMELFIGILISLLIYQYLTIRRILLERANLEILSEEQRRLAETEYWQSQDSNDQLQIVNNQLNETVRELNQLKESLEDRVARRTQALEQARLEAVRANESKGEFLANVSHELRTPLTAILGFSEAIQRRLESRVMPQVQNNEAAIAPLERIGRNVNIIVDESKRLTNLINDVLDLSKIESGRMDWHMDKININDILNQSYQSTQTLFTEKGIGYEAQLADELPVIIGDHNKLVQVMINLMSNAVKFTDAGSVTIKTKLSEDGTHIIAQVSDTGMGISPDELPLVFEKFKQVGDTLTDKPTGTGLGLAISKEILDYHNGTIEIASIVGEGTTVSVTLPVHVEIAEHEQLTRMVRTLRPVNIDDADNLSDKTILIADDEKSVRQLLTEMLEEAGYAVIEAVDGVDAIEKVREHKPDLILLDVMMPKMDGFAVSRTLKSDSETRDIPIIIVSIVRDDKQGMRIGVDRYLNKPIDTQLLLSDVRTLLQDTDNHAIFFTEESTVADASITDVLRSNGYTVLVINSLEQLDELQTIDDAQILVINSDSVNPAEALQTIRQKYQITRTIIMID